MTDQEPFDELPEALQEALRGLGGERAPAALRERVTLARMGETAAPPELWQRVAPAVAEEAAARTSGQPSGRLVRFPARRQVAAAAVLVAGIGTVLWMNSGSAPDGPVLARKTPDALRAEYLRRFQAAVTPDAELSPTGQALGRMFGGEAES